MGRDSATSLSPGFRFHPTDEELVRYYLRRKVCGKSFRFDPIAVVDIYKSEPWDLPCQSKLKSRDLEWYFFSGLDKKYGNGSKTNRATEKGYWKTTGKDRPVLHNSRTVGMKKTLVYHSGRAPRGTRTNWVMHEYRMADEELVKAGIVQDAFVLCRIFQKSGTGPKNGEQYGAPFVEEDWEEDEVAPVSGEGAGIAEVLMGDDADAFVETNDLEQNLDTDIASASAALPLNMCYGESSSYPKPQHSQEATEEQKPLVITGGTSERQEDGFLNMPEQLAVDGKTLKDEYKAEARHDGNPLYVDDVFDDLYLDAIDFPEIGDGSFLETNDLLNPIEADLDVKDMLDEYLNYNYLDADDDITKFISFDSPQIKSDGESIPDQGLSSIQNVDEEPNMACKQNFDEAPYSNGASSSKQKPELSKSGSGDMNPLAKRASRFLDSIPAPPAFASELPPKDIAVRLHSAAQSSQHVTAGMIRVTNITLRGNGMDWTLGKNGGFNFVISPDFSQPNNISDALVPVSGKSAFLVSHFWFFLMLFSVLILSLSCKIGSSMYAAGK